MTDHNIDTILVDNVAPIKGDIRDYERLLFCAADVNDIKSRNLTGTKFALLFKGNVPRIYSFDPAAGTPDDDLIIEDDAGNRFIAVPVDPVFITAILLNSVLSGGLLAADAIPGTGQKTAYVRDANDNFVNVSLQTLAAWFDEIGWPAQSIPGSENTVIKLAENLTRQSGGRNRAVLFADGSIGVSGSGAGGATGDVQGGNVGRFIRAGNNLGNQKVFTKFWAGRGSFFALDEDGILWAIGENTNGQLGIGNTQDRAIWVPVQYFIDNSLTVAEVETIPDCQNTYSGTFFRLTNGHLYYAGQNAAGEAGDGTQTQRPTPVRCGTLTGVTKVWAGGGEGVTNAMCFAIASNVLYSWGYNGFGCLGHGNTTTPVLTPTSTGISDVIDCWPDLSSLILKIDGTVWGTGYNAYGELGQGDTTQRTSFTQISALGSDVSALVTSRGNFKHCAALKGVAGAATLWTWGRNGEGQCATGDTVSPKSTPSAPTASFQGAVDEIRCWGSQSLSGMFVRKDNELWGTGYNASGNLARGDVTTIISTFGRVMGMRGNITAWGVMGFQNASGLIVLTDVACMTAGYNSDGQTGQQDAPSRIIIGQLGTILY